MSKMGEELEKRLDEAKYDMYEALKAVKYTMGVDSTELLRDHPITASMVLKVLAKVERLAPH